MPNAKLQPVATPVDPFISAPGISGPVQTQFDFQALRGLSQSLDSALNTAAEIERKRVERETIPANESLLSKWTKDQVQVFNSADPETSEGLKQFNALGVQDADHPYVIQALRKASAVYQVQTAEGGYGAFLRDDKWYGQLVEKSIFSQGEVDQMLQDRRQEFINKLGITSEFAKVAAIGAIQTEERAFRQDLAQDRQRRTQEDNVRAAVTNLSPVAQSVVEHLSGKDDPEYRKATSDAFSLYVTQMTKTLGSPDRAEKVVAQAVETSLLQLARSPDSYAAHHVLDELEKSIGTPTMLPKLEEIRGKVERELNSSKSQAKLSEARASVASKLDDLFLDSNVKGAAAVKDLFSGKAGRDVVAEVARKFDISDPSVLGDVIGEKIAKWSNYGNRTESKPEILAEAIKQAETSPESFQTWLQGVSPDDLVKEDRIQMRSYAAQNAQQDRFSPEVREARGKSFAASVIKFSPIADSEEAAPLLDELQRIHDEAYDESLGQDPGKKNTRSAGLKAKQAMYASEAWKNLTKIQEETSFAFYSQTPEYKASVTDYFNQMKTMAVQDAVDAAAISGNKAISKGAILNEWKSYQDSFDKLMREKYEQLSTEPELTAMKSANRKAEISHRLSSFASQALEISQGRRRAPKDSSVQLTQAVPNQVENLKSLGDVTSIDAASLSKTFSKRINQWNGNAFSYTTGNLLSGVESLARGSGGEFFSLARRVSGMGPGLETVLIARLQDNYTPKSILEAGESQYGVMVTSIESDDMARDAYLALLTVKGMTPESFAAGTTPGGYPLDALSPKGVPFWKVMSPEHYAVYHTDEDLKAAAEEIATDPVNSLAAKVMLQWRLDPTKQEDVDYFISSQQKIINVRSAAFVPYYDATGKPTSLAKIQNIPPLPERQALLKEIAYRKPKVSDKDAPWVQKAMRRINGE